MHADSTNLFSACVGPKSSRVFHATASCQPTASLARPLPKGPEARTRMSAKWAEPQGLLQATDSESSGWGPWAAHFTRAPQVMLCHVKNHKLKKKKKSQTSVKTYMQFSTPRQPKAFLFQQPGRKSQTPNASLEHITKQEAPERDCEPQLWQKQGIFPKKYF